MRISDWSSDVCSSDLRGIGVGEAVEGAVHGIDQGPYLARQAVGREAHGEVSGTDRRRLARGTGERAQAPCADEPDENQGGEREGYEDDAEILQIFLDQEYQIGRAHV